MPYTNSEIIAAASIALGRYNSYKDRWWPKPTASMQSGTYLGNMRTVTLNNPLTGGTIYYTLDGNIPTTQNYEYISGSTIEITSGLTVLTARTYKDGKYSAPAAYVYKMVTLAPAEEHIEISGITASGALTKVYYKDTAAAEHIEISSITATGTLRLNVSPAPTTVANISDGVSEIWDTKIEVTLDYPVTVSTVSSSASSFSLSNGNSTYGCMEATARADGLAITLTMSSFASASGSCALAYNGNGIDSPNLPMAAWTKAFTPTHLAPPEFAEHIEISGITASGALTKVYYKDTAAAEHIEISSITATGTLKHINDI